MADALLIMALGMGGVFVFLLVLIVTMKVLVALLPPEEIEERSGIRLALASNQSKSGTDQTLIAVLQAAVHAYEADSKTDEQG